jgi:hypothetical protein
LIAKLSQIDDLDMPVVISDHCGNGQGFAAIVETSVLQESEDSCCLISVEERD